MCMDENWEALTRKDYNTLHSLGVLYGRIHGFFCEGKRDTASLQRQIRHFANSYPVKQLGCGLSTPLPLGAWASLKDFILHDQEVSNLPIIADHVGCATPTDIGSSSLDDFVQLLHADRIHLKISALYHRSRGSIVDMKPIIQRFADSAPSAPIWCSDWPHVDASSRSPDDQVIPRTTNPKRDLVLLQDWLSIDQSRKMLVHNPERLLGH
ncbi:hypothetical protein NUU61_000675 [Penicillium alfredii]|uniref:Amidohydrolase-related domain-containing protein n=1 Tax=Penicillium alfredii TaxID=1506179 RepID=A0A9W9KR84_9EURO|nr:uncharacterized protein NUU61_000675 [Penicillium alfredii]KAJ5114916.1 hypothetical protein NUU61_000675 [Penicillium alfredii]